MKHLGLVLLVVFLSACSNKQLFDITQETKRNECRRLPPNQYEECMRDVETSFEEYMRKRQEVVEH
ncbi:hypothetical protein [Aliidiomarina haloalkalitolerans]|uniref:Lipoprotein n=1 Tax=Aliidiomarina haloalkalitolerans TaxID=859059 RepID=A0A432VYS7_9GAMM|nr:hypothetical protein [Aliidiomarina haloalkalitolerans]RUO21812.1 hypothetical protein CWE06_02895 [Aliidiomarina haloalkalitolerans]